MNLTHEIHTLKIEDLSSTVTKDRQTDKGLSNPRYHYISQATQKSANDWSSSNYIKSQEITNCPMTFS